MKQSSKNSENSNFLSSQSELLCDSKRHGFAV